MSYQAPFETSDAEIAEFGPAEVVAVPTGLISAPEGRDASPVSVRMYFHVVVEDQFSRAATARAIFASGHHAEVYSDAAEFIEHAPEQGIVLCIEDGSGYSAALVEKMATIGLWLPVVGYANSLDCETIVDGIKAGVLDFVVGSLDSKRAQDRLRKSYVQGQAIQSARHRQTCAKRAIAALSNRESEVLHRVSSGLSNKEIARQLDISPRTVEIHRMKMMAKLGVKSSAEAIRLQLEAAGVA